jgi:16S rRNA (cytidine1402-2'-O)-methyltransferase
MALHGRGAVCAIVSVSSRNRRPGGHNNESAIIVAKMVAASGSGVSAGRLYVVATPIGNLQDISARARAILAEVEHIAAEDTRHSGAMLRQFGIATPLLSLHEHNEKSRADELIGKLQAGAAIALISDAGTPCISDPGYDLVRRAAALGIEVLAIPGPSAVIAALSIAGLPTDRFCFEGFLPAKREQRRTHLKELAAEPRTLVFYESPHRIAETLHDCAELFGAARECCMAREITKLHESTYRGSLATLVAELAQNPDMQRGEIVLVIAGAAAVEQDERAVELDRVLRELLAELPLKQAAHLASRLCGARENEAYKRALEIKKG